MDVCMWEEGEWMCMCVGEGEWVCSVRKWRNSVHQECMVVNTDVLSLADL